MKRLTEIREVNTDDYSLVYADNTGEFLCSGCNQTKEGKHMLHTVFYQEQQDTEPICMSCVKEYSEL